MLRPQAPRRNVLVIGSAFAVLQPDRFEVGEFSPAAQIPRHSPASQHLSRGRGGTAQRGRPDKTLPQTAVQLHLYLYGGDDHPNKPADELVERHPIVRRPGRWRRSMTPNSASSHFSAGSRGANARWASKSCGSCSWRWAISRCRSTSCSSFSACAPTNPPRRFFATKWHE